MITSNVIVIIVSGNLVYGNDSPNFSPLVLSPERTTTKYNGFSLQPIEITNAFYVPPLLLTGSLKARSRYFRFH